MLIRHHDLEAYYLKRRLQLLETLDQHATQAFDEEDYLIADWQIEMLEREYADVANPEDLCQTLKRIYPEHLFAKKPKES